jgi:hypothetical protein
MTDLEFSAMKDVDPRTLRRWKGRPEFQELVEQHKVELTNNVTNSAISKINNPVPKTGKQGEALRPPDPVRLEDDPVFDPGLTPDEMSYLQVKDTLIRMAMDGNQGAMDLYLKHYGKSFVDAESKDFSDYDGYDDDQLIEEIVTWVGIERISEWLARKTAVAIES